MYESSSAFCSLFVQQIVCDSERHLWNGKCKSNCVFVWPGEKHTEITTDFFCSLKVSSFLPYSHPFSCSYVYSFTSSIVFHLNVMSCIPSTHKYPIPLPQHTHKASWTCTQYHCVDQNSLVFINFFNTHSLDWPPNCPLVEPCHLPKGCSISLALQLFIHCKLQEQNVFSLLIQWKHTKKLFISIRQCKNVYISVQGRDIFRSQRGV